jgi:hypothetical protein
MTMRRPQRALLRLTLLGTLIAVPAVARPPWAPSDQYDFFDRESKTIFDKKTGLRWDREVPLTKKSFGAAKSYCETTFGGRLPTIKELLTILSEEPSTSYQGAAVVTQLIDPYAFPPERTPVSAPYWTSTPINENWRDGPFWALSFSDGKMVQANNTEALYQRCVKQGL